MDLLPLATAKARLSELVERVAGQHDRVMITRNGRAAAVLISPDDLESLEETLALLTDPHAMAEIRAAEAEIERGDIVSLAEVRAELAARLRLE